MIKILTLSLCPICNGVMIRLQDSNRFRCPARHPITTTPIRPTIAPIFDPASGAE